jgi:hypothetical protein
MGGLAVSGEVVEPRAVGATTALLVLVLGEGVVLRIVTVPGNSAPCSSPQTQSSVFMIGVRLSVMGSVSPCQFPSLTVLIHQLQEAFPGDKLHL